MGWGDGSARRLWASLSDGQRDKLVDMSAEMAVVIMAWATRPSAALEGPLDEYVPQVVHDLYDMSERLHELERDDENFL